MSLWILIQIYLPQSHHLHPLAVDKVGFNLNSPVIFIISPIILLCRTPFWSSVLFMWIQILITILENLCVTEKTSQKWRHIETNFVFADGIILWIIIQLLDFIKYLTCALDKLCHEFNTEKCWSLGVWALAIISYFSHLWSQLKRKSVVFSLSFLNCLMLPN